MNHWGAFAGIVATQGTVFLLVKGLQRSLTQNERHKHSFWVALIAGLIGGLILGLAFDQLIGQRLGFFQYYLKSPSFRIVNAALSYGLVVSTALQLSLKPISISRRIVRRSFTLLCLLCASFIGAATWLPTPFTLAIAVGAVIIVMGELAEFYFLSTVGPVIEAISGFFRRALRNWIGAIFLGSIYELANAAFPVWRWFFAGAPASIIGELIIIAFGYVVLLHVSRFVGLVVLTAMRRLFSTA